MQRTHISFVVLLMPYYRSILLVFSSPIDKRPHRHHHHQRRQFNENLLHDPIKDI